MIELYRLATECGIGTLYGHILLLGLVGSIFQMIAQSSFKLSTKYRQSVPAAVIALPFSENSHLSHTYPCFLPTGNSAQTGSLEAVYGKISVILKSGSGPSFLYQTARRIGDIILFGRLYFE